MFSRFQRVEGRVLLPLFVLAFWPIFGVASEARTGRISAESQAKVAQLIQNALATYRIDAGSNNSATNSQLLRYTKIETSFREASRLMPDRLDLRFGIASALIGQALHTNSPFDQKIKGALRIYQEIQALDTNGFEAPMLYAAYTRAIRETNTSEAAISQLLALHPERTKDCLEKFRRMDDLFQIILNDKPSKAFPKDGCHAIVILGAGLETNGTIKPKLVGRLEQGLKLAKIYRKSPIILTGGNPKGGITEAYAMRLWFLKKGISRKRLLLEDQARDTLGNAFLTAPILAKMGVTHVTLVTSANHIRRGLADFEEVCLLRGLKLHFNNLVGTGEPEFDEKIERLSIYRDVLRANGFWAYPGIQQ